MSTRAVVVCGGGRRSDPWHDLAATGQAVADVLGGRGILARVTSDPADVLVGGRFEADLLVVNSSERGQDDSPHHDQHGPADEDPTLLAAAIAAHVAAGLPVLALHSAAQAFPDQPAWASILGARWVDGRSMHPDLDLTTVQVQPGPWGIGTGLADVTVTDERYCHLEPVTDLGALRPHLTHRHEGVVHPLAWAREVGPTGARVVYDALGHDVRSYASSTRRALLEAELDWLLRLR